MKNIKKIVSILLLVAMALSLVACGNMTPDKMIEKALAAQEGIKSSHTVVDYDIIIDTSADSDIGIQSGNIKMSIDMLAFNDPMKAKATLKTSFGGAAAEGISADANISLDMYVDQEYVYINMLGQWMKMSTEYSEKMGANVINNTSTDFYLKNAWNFKLGEEEKIGEYNTRKIEGVLSKESFKEAIETMGLGQILASASLSIEDLSEFLEDIPAIFWIDKKSFHVVKTQFDMSGMLETLLQEEETEGATASMITTITNDQINSVEDFEIPEEAKNAQDMSGE